MFLLCACSSNKVDVNYDENNKDVISASNFIEPTSEDNIFEYLNDDTKDLLYKANDDKDVDTSVLKNLGKDLLEGTFIDYSGNTINLSDYKDSKLVIEVVAYWCSHCKEQALKYNEDLLNNMDDVIFIQYFASGDKEEIEAFYKDIDLDVPSNIIIGINDDDLTNNIILNYSLEYTPTFFFFNKGELNWESVGTISSDQYNLFKDVAFNNALDLSTLKDADGKDILDYIRDEEDVKNDLSSANYTKLEALDNDGYTVDLTLKYIGSNANLLNQLSDDSSFTAEANLENYNNSELIVIFIDEYNNNYIDLINNFTANNKDINVVVVNNSDENNDTIANLLDAPLVSIMNQVPEIFNEISFSSYPSALFIKEGTITGVYSNIKSSDKLLEAYNIFLTDNSVALLANN